MTKIGSDSGTIPEWILPVLIYCCVTNDFSNQLFNYRIIWLMKCELKLFAGIMPPQSGMRGMILRGRPSNCLSAQREFLLGPLSERLQGRKKILSTKESYYWGHDLM
jgi:hypothetical protein